MPPTQTSALYFASTALELRQTDSPEDYPQDIFIGDVCYRKVDPPYFAWLRRRMETAKHQHASGRLPQAAWDELRERFNGLQAWALKHYSRESLQAAIHSFESASYAPPANRQPAPYLYPPSGDWPFSTPVAPEAVRQVDAIREEAFAKGWREAQLYQNRGRFRYPLGRDYGLVCCLEPGKELGAVTKLYIELIHTRSHDRHALRFYNSDMFPPRAMKQGGPA